MLSAHVDEPKNGQFAVAEPKRVVKLLPLDNLISISMHHSHVDREGKVKELIWFDSQTPEMNLAPLLDETNCH